MENGILQRTRSEADESVIVQLQKRKKLKDKQTHS
jgi:hypothetical protein